MNDRALNEVGPPSTEVFNPEGDLSGGAWIAFHPAARLESPLADRKALVIITAFSLLITVLSFASHSIALLTLSSRPTVEVISLILLGTVVTCVIIGGGTAWAAFTTPAPPLPRVFSHFRDIAAANLDDYIRQMGRLDSRQSLEAILIYNHCFAIQTHVKFQRVRHSLTCLRLAMKAWMILMLLVAVADRIHL